MTTLVVIQARMGSSRLPGKVMMPLAGRPLLQRMVAQVAAARSPFKLTVATTVEPADDPIAALCAAIGVRCFRGHPTDLLDRHYHAAVLAGADIVVKIPSDCPLIDPDVIDRVLAFFRSTEGRYDYVSNLHPATYPDGNDVEVMTIAALEQAFREARRPLEREHTTPFLWDNPGRFRLGNVTWETRLDASMSHRFTVDYREDYDFVKAVYEALSTPQNPIVRLGPILELLAARPDIMAINARYAGVNWYRHHLGELRTVSARETRVPGDTA
ncbi:cytidylyltransferase domain-containing protein [Sorangium sp. So ce426]|uniref:cytidylyltransferase domain-containing protein n=1 Tax=Sorangium sp. So ce426 TaxID=3133312 RepID=UPI003F5B47E8